MADLKSSFTLFILLFVHYGFAQNNLSSSLTLIIDNTLVTNGITIKFTNSNDESLYESQYYIGKNITIDQAIFNQEVYMQFDYTGSLNGEYKDYHYKIKFVEGYLSNSNYIIVRIFNLDKKIYRKAFCKTLESYAVEIETQNYNQISEQCRAFIKF